MIHFQAGTCLAVSVVKRYVLHTLSAEDYGRVWAMTDERKKVLVFTSPDSQTIIYACGWCRLTVPGSEREAAEACCRCQRCGNERIRGRTACAKCDADARRDHELERHGAALSLPIIDGYDGPVYVDNESRYYEDQWAAAEALYDDGCENFADVIVHPCNVTQSPVPDIHDWLEETWSCEFEYDYYELSKVASDAIATCAAALESERPTVWAPRMNERIVLASPEANNV